MAYNNQLPLQNSMQDIAQNFVPPNQLQYNTVNPQAFTNQDNINNMFGYANQGTFTRTLGSPLMQTVDPLTGQTLDPTMNQSPSMPAYPNTTAIPPPNGVQTQITPTYDINNL